MNMHDSISVRCENGHTIYADPRDERGIALVRSGGTFNPQSLAMWRLLLEEQTWTHVIDVGANYGEMLAGVKLPRSAMVIALEPNPFVIPYLKRTIQQSGLAVELMTTAASSRSGTARLTIDRDWSGLSSLEGTEKDSVGHVIEVVEVPTTTLATLIRNHSTDMHLVRLLLKIDVERHEVPVIQGLADVLDELNEFAALVEIVHLGSADIEWLLARFQFELLASENDKLTKVDVATVDELQSILSSTKYYRPDVVLRRRVARLQT
jgi:FkbM family methyltransferase